MKLALVALLLSGCAAIDQYPPIYQCERLAEFGCPDTIHDPAR